MSTAFERSVYENETPTLRNSDDKQSNLSYLGSTGHTIELIIMQLSRVLANYWCLRPIAKSIPCRLTIVFLSYGHFLVAGTPGTTLPGKERFYCIAFLF